MIKENFRLTLNARLVHIKPAPTEAIRRIIDTCSGDPDLHVVRDVIRVIANTGMTNSELCKLRVSNIDIDQKWLFAGDGRASRYAKRTLPLGPKTLEALMDLHRMNPDSAFVLGDHPRTRFAYVVSKTRSVGPGLSRGRLVMRHVRLNFLSRLFSSGIPLSIVNYCLGRQDPALLMPRLALTIQQKLEIMRRNFEQFFPEL